MTYSGVNSFIKHPGPLSPTSFWVITNSFFPAALALHIKAPNPSSPIALSSVKVEYVVTLTWLERGKYLIPKIS